MFTQQELGAYNNELTEVSQLLQFESTLIENREQYCIEKFYHNETECFDNGFPWTTFPTKFSPVVR